MGKKCTLKNKFKTKELADNFAVDYMQRIVLTFYPMTSYYCYKHNAYHVGHNSYSNKKVGGLTDFQS